MGYASVHHGLHMLRALPAFHMLRALHTNDSDTKLSHLASFIAWFERLPWINSLLIKSHPLHKELILIDSLPHKNAFNVLVHMVREDHKFAVNALKGEKAECQLVLSLAKFVHQEESSGSED